jgi:hypothetical protein
MPPDRSVYRQVNGDHPAGGALDCAGCGAGLRLRRRRSASVGRGARLQQRGRPGGWPGGQALLSLKYLGGGHGREVIDAGHAGALLHGAGAMLRRFHDLPGPLVHGDYGPQNLLFDARHRDSPVVLD